MAVFVEKRHILGTAPEEPVKSLEKMISSCQIAPTYLDKLVCATIKSYCCQGLGPGSGMSCSFILN